MDNQRNLYHVSISFLQPAEATVPIAAESPEQAKELLTKMFSNRANFQIHDCYDVKDCPEIEQMTDDVEVEDDEDPTVH